MKRIRLLISLFMLVGLLSALPQHVRIVIHKIGANSVIPVRDSDDPNVKTPIVRWRNGESLPGDIESANETALTWKSPLFDDPLQIDWHVLDRIAWTPQSDSVSDPFSFALKDGSYLYGDIISIDGDSITIKSSRHGDTKLKRSEVLIVRRQSRGNLLFSGPNGNLGWEVMENQPEGKLVKSSNPNTDYTPALAAGPGGQFLIRNWNRGALLTDTVLPDQLDLSFKVSSIEQPDFTIAFGDDTRSALRLETWDDELVIAQGDDFAGVTKLDSSDRSVALRVLWDKKAESCSIFKDTGELITTWKIPDTKASPQPHLILQNKGINLSLDYLQIRTWDGKTMPSQIDPKVTNVELSDGRRVSGQFLTDNSGTGSVKIQKTGETAPTELSISDLDELVFSTDSPSPASNPEMKLLYNDGTLLFGHLVSITNGEASIITSFTSSPLVSSMDSSRRLIIRPPESKDATPTPLPDITTMDKIQIGDTILHGTLVCTGNPMPQWTPVGGIAPARPATSLSSEITKAPSDKPSQSADTDLFYLSSGDVLPGKLKSIDREGAEFESTVVPAQKFTPDQLNAIQFVASANVNVKGFSDPAWQIKGDDKVQITGDKLEMESGGSIGCSTVMQSGEIRFKYSSNGFSALRLHLFCAGKDDTRSIKLLLGNTGSQFYSGIEAAGGQFESEVQTAVKPNSDIPIRLKIGDHNLELLIDDISVQQFPIEPAKCAGSGLIIEPADIWGNQTYRVLLSDFSSIPAEGRTWVPAVNPEVKSQALTVPRFEKNDPPQHLLLAANGDVLRGEIEAATDSHFGFRSGMETFNVPRDRVKAVIILKPVDKSDKQDPVKKPTLGPLDAICRRGIPFRMNFGQMALSNLVNYLHLSCFDCKFIVPDKDISRPVSFTGQLTLREVLERICFIYNLRYQLNDDGTVVLQEAETAPGDLSQKIFWVKVDKIPKQADLVQALTSKGISFPKGSSVQLDPNSGMLSMSNTEENLAKLSALLDSDYGGNLGTPTHWLLLGNGARFAIVADKFGPDFIEGHHPLYGALKVPSNQIVSIRTSKPMESIAMTSLENWRLVNAPEPVIPDSGGTSSPLVGKVATTFKVPLLDGGTFDLAALKGKIVIIDFWATWCGPCVKSLPGLVQAVSAFPSDRLQLITLNQGESSPQVKRFLKMRDLNFTVGLDSDQSIAQKYGVDGIPRTIIVGPDGVVAWDQTGFNEDGEDEFNGVIKKLLDAPATPHTPAK